MTTDFHSLFERLWSGAAPMEDWTAAVSGGVVHPVDADVASISTSYFFGNVTAIRTAEGLVLVDSGSRDTAHLTHAALRRWDQGRVHTIILTHGHIDHTWGARLYDQEADQRGVARPRVVAHRSVLDRFRRYDLTRDLNTVVMGRQFNQPGYVFPGEHRRPDQVYDDELALTVGGVRFELMHGRGETDDATFVWMPDKEILASGDFVIWVFPNAGNPRKVQRFAPDWAAALRRMQALKPNILLPGHGPVVAGRERAAQVLADGAQVLESLVTQTRDLMNRGSTLDAILHSVRVPEGLLAKPYLRPKYDDPEFVVRGIWHLYGGWFDGNPAHLKPAPEAELGAELVALAGGVDKLVRRAEELAGAGRARLAAHLIEYAAADSPADARVQKVRAAIYGKCMEGETSLIGKAIYAVYQREAMARSNPNGQDR
jgi:alkyl sulfatase BDS1-like metallo-beta-lactamase superfamily hydrolase